MYYVYVLECADGSLYTGMTPDYRRRINMHYNKLPGCAKYTKSHSVTGLAALWETDGESAARKMEFRFKKLRREQKLALIAAPERLAEFLPALAEENIRPVYGASLEDCVKGE